MSVVPGCADLLDRAGHSRLVDGRQLDRGAVAGQALGRRQADARAPADDNRDGAMQQRAVQ